MKKIEEILDMENSDAVDWLDINQFKYVLVEKSLADKLYCGNCQYLKPTEKNQTDKKEPHFCHLYAKRVNHYDEHPLLPRLDECLMVGIANNKI